MYHSCPSHDNISDISTDPTQVLRIDCDVPVTIEHTIDQTTEHTTTSDPTTTEQTTHQTTTYDPMTTEQTTRQTIQFDPTPDTSGNDEYSSTTTTSTQTTDSLQSTTMRTK